MNTLRRLNAAVNPNSAAMTMIAPNKADTVKTWLVRCPPLTKVSLRLNMRFGNKVAPRNLF